MDEFEPIYLPDLYEFVLRPTVASKCLFTMKSDCRRRRKPVHVEFKVQNGLVIGDFILHRIVVISADGNKRETVL